MKRLTHSAMTHQLLWKIDIKKRKHATLNGHISKTRTNLGSRLRFPESSFNFLQNSVIFCALFPRGYTTGEFAPLKPPIPLPAARRAEKVKKCCESHCPEKWKTSRRTSVLKSLWRKLVGLQMTQLTITCSKSTIETLEKVVKYVQS